MDEQKIWKSKCQSSNVKWRTTTVPKTKTKSSAKKRFKLTATGKILRKRAFRSHILEKKSAKRKRALRRKALVHKTMVKKIRELI